MATYLIEGAPDLDRVEAASWNEAEALAAKAGGTVAGELVEEVKKRIAPGGMEFKFAAEDGMMSFSGYGARFGNVDSYGDVIAAGAFKKTLQAHKAAKTMPAMLLEHGMGPLPIGVWDKMSEDENGLLVEGRLLDTQLGLDTYKTMKAGAIGGLSIGFRATEFAMQMKPDDARRTLKAVDLFEVSVVGFPANGLARVSSVKSAEEIKTLRDFEAFLRDAGGFSNARAKAIASHGFKAFDAGRDDGEGLGDELAVKAADHLLFILQGF